MTVVVATATTAEVVITVTDADAGAPIAAEAPEIRMPHVMTTRPTITPASQRTTRKAKIRALTNLQQIATMKVATAAIAAQIATRIVITDLVAAIATTMTAGIKIVHRILVTKPMATPLRTSHVVDVGGRENNSPNLPMAAMKARKM